MVNVPTQQVSQIKNQTNKAANKMADIIGLEFLIVVVVGIIGTLVLNYFSVFPLSQKFPKIFGFLPHRAVVADNLSINGQNGGKNNKANVPNDVTEYLFACPNAHACPHLKQVYDRSDNQFKGSALAEIDQQSQIQAIIDGKITRSEQKDGVVSVVEESADGTFEITYIVVGKRASSSQKDSAEIKKHDLLGTISGDPQELTPYTSQKYYLYLAIKEISTKNFIPVKWVEGADGMDFL